MYLVSHCHNLLSLSEYHVFPFSQSVYLRYHPRHIPIVDMISELVAAQINNSNVLDERMI